jgi:DNA-directed RNA polymerase subunit RPC12/RpoP
VYIVIVCGGCGRLLVAAAEAKTRSCPYCGYRVVVAKARRLGSASNARQASELVQRLKLSEQQR